MSPFTYFVLEVSRIHKENRAAFNALQWDGTGRRRGMRSLTMFYNRWELLLLEIASDAKMLRLARALVSICRNLYYDNQPTIRNC